MGGVKKERGEIERKSYIKKKEQSNNKERQQASKEQKSYIISYHEFWKKKKKKNSIWSPGPPPPPFLRPKFFFFKKKSLPNFQIHLSPPSPPHPNNNNALTNINLAHLTQPAAAAVQQKPVGSHKIGISLNLALLIGIQPGQNGGQKFDLAILIA